MPASDDISNLFQQVGGKASRYQELTRHEKAQQSSERWPLLAALRERKPLEVPAVHAPAVWPARPAMAAESFSPAPRAAAPLADHAMGLRAPARPPAPVAPAVAPEAPPALLPDADFQALGRPSPLARLAGHAHAAVRSAEPAPKAAALPDRLDAIFARLGGQASATPAPSPAARSPW